MLAVITSVFKKLLDFFAVKQPKLTIEPLPDTADEAGEVYRLTEPSGETRDVYVRRRWEKDEKTGEKIAVTDLKSPSTEYVFIHKIDHENTSLRGRPAVHSESVDKLLSFEDHEALIEYFEQRNIAHPTDRFKRQIVRLYPPTPKDKSVKTDLQTTLELKL